MSEYDFRTLSSYDFENLVRDLLQKKLGVTLELFKNGKDGGIDIRHSKSAENGGNNEDIIIQCKHYGNFNDLYRHLKDTEKPKVIRLNPYRYILAISTPISPLQKNKLAKLFSGYCKSANDIYGQRDINGLLRDYPEVEKAHFKLWLSSVALLERLNKSDVYNYSSYIIKKALNTLKKYVETDAIIQAKAMLSVNNFCIISGGPGVGKSTLAEMLLLQYFDAGYEIYKIDSMDNAFYFANPKDSSLKKFFYYDDVFGRTSFHEKISQNNEEVKLLDFINLIRDYNSVLVITTRDYILNQAKMEYDLFSKLNIDTMNCVIDLSKYTAVNKAKILYNHVYFSDIPHEFKKALLRSGNYLKIANHRNFNPRMIEWMTNMQFIKATSESEYIKLFIKSLDDPSDLWDRVFSKISEASRSLLFALFGMSNRCLLEDLKQAFTQFHNHRSSKYRFKIGSLDFNHAFKELEGAFITLEKIADCLDIFTMKNHVQNIVSFYNPSVEDFLRTRLIIDPDCVLDIVTSAVFFEQCYVIMRLGNNHNLEYVNMVLPEEYTAFSASVKENSAIIIKKMLELFTTESCQIGYQYSMFGGFAKQEVDLLSRASIAIELYQIARMDGLSEIIAMFDAISVNIRPDRSYREQIIDILSIIENDDDLYDIIYNERFVYFASEILLHDLENFEEVEEVNRFRDILDIDTYRYESALEDFIRNYYLNERSRIGNVMYKDINKQIIDIAQRIGYDITEDDDYFEDDEVPNDQTDVFLSFDVSARSKENMYPKGVSEEDLIRDMFSTLLE